MEWAPPALRGCRRGRDERLRARRARARGRGERVRRRCQPPTWRACRPTGCCRRASATRAHNVPAGDGVELIYSSAVPAENVERAAARERGIPERPRAELLAELTGLRRTIAVAGTHGKTTTASMLVHALRGAGLDPGWLVGGSVGAGLANAEWGSGEWLVVEADESDRSMLSLNVEIAVLTNVELDHHATFASLDELREAFRRVPRRPSARGHLGPARAAGAARRARRPLRRRGGDPDRRGLMLPLASRRRCAWPFPVCTTRSNAAGALRGRPAGRRAGRARDRRPRRLPRSRPALSAARPHRAGCGRVRRLRAPPDGGRRHPRGGAHARAPAAGGGIPAPPVLAHGSAGARVRPWPWRMPT